MLLHHLNLCGLVFDICLYSDNHAPGRQRTSFERRKNNSQTTYVPQQNTPQVLGSGSSLAAPSATVTITAPTTTGVFGHSNQHPGPSVSPLSVPIARTTASPSVSGAAIKLSHSQPSLPQAFQNLNMGGQEGIGGQGVVQGLAGHLQGQAVKRSQSFTSATLTAQHQQQQQQQQQQTLQQHQQFHGGQL